MRKPNLPVGHTENGRIMHRSAGLSMEQIQIGFPPAMLDQMNIRAGKCHETRAAYVRRLVEADLRESGGVA